MTDEELADKLADAHRKYVNARQRAQDFKEQRDRALREVAALRVQIARQQSADAVACAASALPDVVKTRALQLALSDYRRKRAP
jgi:hypothetical protein